MTSMSVIRFGTSLPKPKPVSDPEIEPEVAPPAPPKTSAFQQQALLANGGDVLPDAGKTKPKTKEKPSWKLPLALSAGIFALITGVGGIQQARIDQVEQTSTYKTRAIISGIHNRYSNDRYDLRQSEDHAKQLINAFDSRLNQADPKVAEEMKTFLSQKNSRERRRLMAEELQKVSAEMAKLSSDGRSRVALTFLSEIKLTPEEIDKLKSVEETFRLPITVSRDEWHVPFYERRYAEAFDTLVDVLKPHVLHQDLLEHARAEAQKTLKSLDSIEKKRDDLQLNMVGILFILFCSGLSGGITVPLIYFLDKARIKKENATQ